MTVADASLTPYQAQAANVTPPPSYSGRNALQHTIVAERGPYLIQTPHSGIVLGLGEETGFELGITKKHEIFEVTDDSYVKPAIKTCKHAPRLHGALSVQNVLLNGQGLTSIVRRTSMVGGKKPPEKEE